MADIASAQAMVNYYADRPPQVRGRTVYIQFSNHEELKVDSSSQVGRVWICPYLTVAADNRRLALQQPRHIYKTNSWFHFFNHFGAKSRSTGTALYDAWVPVAYRNQWCSGLTAH